MVNSFSFRLETDRHYMRELNPGDAEGFYKLNLHPDIYRFTTDPPFESVEHAEQFLSNYDPYGKSGFGRWAVLKKTDDAFIGWCGLKFLPEENEVDVGYRLLPEFWGQGIASETALTCCRYGFEIAGLKRIVARVHKENQRSVRVVEKMGMLYEKDIMHEGVPWSGYVLNNAHFKKAQSSGYHLPIS